MRWRMAGSLTGGGQISKTAPRAEAWSSICMTVAQTSSTGRIRAGDMSTTPGQKARWLMVPGICRAATSACQRAAMSVEVWRRTPRL